MTQHLANARVLVADDQQDVARTLCRPLHKAGARLRFTADGHAALQEINTRPFDLLLIDMKMPPEEWGGLWLLRQLKDGGWRIPSLVLSGEGSKQQIIEALRLDAVDWVDKDKAGEELLERCVEIATTKLDMSLEHAASHLPTPLAYRFARYARTTDPDKKVLEGLHTLESVLRFAAALGLSSTPPAPLRGITSDRLAAPSMGTWFTLCTTLANLPGAGNDFTRMFSWLVPERSDHQPVQDLISVRNALAHGRSAPTAAQTEQLDGLLRRFAHRAACSWRADLAVPTSMTYDGTKYAIDVLILRGIGKPVPDTVMTQAPVITGQPLLVNRDAPPVPLSPWLVTHTDSASDVVRCLQFDGLQRAKGGLTPSTPFRYAKTDEGDDIPTISHPQGEWRTLAPWATTV
ncbi:response regulator [Streptomyces pseudovenezuelae]|uniref:CheY-like chemotaxis protein n=1 Tax=Streptomyces pseudovenezuelae TaxID=67350 RepID=A0ABT6LZ21_9ACTN|nr:response regulator [Streptomyces pseudovenezuelae]MDH6221550.1 CheY-like chemotaxis protein [Streptomyces pseudovenezuelae]